MPHYNCIRSTGAGEKNFLQISQNFPFWHISGGETIYERGDFI